MTDVYALSHNIIFNEMLIDDQYCCDELNSMNHVIDGIKFEDLIKKVNYCDEAWFQFAYISIKGLQDDLDTEQ